jgi:hypothetical protein
VKKSLSEFISKLLWETYFEFSIKVEAFEQPTLGKVKITMFSKAFKWQLMHYLMLDDFMLNFIFFSWT